MKFVFYVSSVFNCFDSVFTSTDLSALKNDVGVDTEEDAETGNGQPLELPEYPKALVWNEFKF